MPGLPIRPLLRFAPTLGLLLLFGCTPQDWQALGVLLGPDEATGGVSTQAAPSTAPSVSPSPGDEPLPPRPSATNLPEFDVHFVVATAHEEARKAASLAQLQREVEILNHYFVDAHGVPLIHFRFKAATMYEDLIAADPGFAQVLDAQEPYQNAFWDRYKAEKDPRIAWDTQAITFVVADHWNENEGFKYGDSFGGRTSGGPFGSLPFVQLDWIRLNHQIQAPEEHEMGHAFGLPHVCNPDLTASDQDSNIMTSYIDCPSNRNGKRNQGFTPDQVAIIMARISEYQEKFRQSAEAQGKSSPTPAASPSGLPLAPVLGFD